MSKKFTSKPGSFAKLDKDLYTSAVFDTLSIEAKYLYIFMADRLRLSRRNGWVDGKGRIYIYCTVDTAMKILGKSKSTCLKVLNELKSFGGIGLIKAVKQKTGKPNIIYVRDLSYFNDKDTVENSVEKSVEN